MGLTLEVVFPRTFDLSRIRHFLYRLPCRLRSFRSRVWRAWNIFLNRTSFRMLLMYLDCKIFRIALTRRKRLCQDLYNRRRLSAFDAPFNLLRRAKYTHLRRRTYCFNFLRRFALSRRIANSLLCSNVLIRWILFIFVR